MLEIRPELNLIHTHKSINSIHSVVLLTLLSLQIRPLSPCPAVTPFHIIPITWPSSPTRSSVSHFSQWPCSILHTLAHFHSLQLPGCLVCCCFFSPELSSLLFSPAWKLLAAVTIFCPVMRLLRKCSYWFKCIMPQSGFTAVLPAVQLLTISAGWDSVLQV